MTVFSKKTLMLGLVLTLALAAPDAAWARAGGGKSSMGSRGGHTYVAPPSSSARPIERSVTPRPTAPAPEPSFAPQAQPQPMQSQSFFQRHPILTGIASGFLGASLANWMFGSNMSGLSSFGSGMGGLLQLLLLGGVIYIVFSMLRRRASSGQGFPSFGGFGGMGSASQADAPFAAPSAAPAPPAQDHPLELTRADHLAFNGALMQIQTLWGQGDITRLRALVTPEMLGYFNEELAANTSRGEVNCVSKISVSEERVLETWSEAAMDYATVHLRWNAVDFMARLDRTPADSDYIVSGNPTSPVEAQEVWTFTRARDGGKWLLSAIQQVD